MDRLSKTVGKRMGIRRISIYHTGILLLLFCLFYFPFEFRFNQIQTAHNNFWHLGTGIALLFGIFGRPWSLPVIFAASLLNQTVIMGQPLSLNSFLFSLIFMLAVGALPNHIFQRTQVSLQLRTLRDTTYLILVVAISAAILTFGYIFASDNYTSQLSNQLMYIFLREFLGMLVVSYFWLVAFDSYNLSLQSKQMFPRAFETLLLKLRRISVRIWWEIVGLTVGSGVFAYVLINVFTQNSFHFFLILCLPTIWMSIRFGRDGNLYSISLLGLITLLTEGSIQINSSELLEFQLIGVIVAPLFLFLGCFVSDQRRTESALQSSINQFKVLSESAPVGICLLNSLGQIEMVNQFWQNLTGIQERDAIGQSLIHLLKDEDRETIKPIIEKLSTITAPTALSFRTNQPFGQTLWVMGNISRLPTETDQKPLFLCTLTDITNIKSSEQEIKKRQELLQSFINGLPDPAWLKDREGRYLAINRALVTLYNRDDYIGKRDDEIWDLAQAKTYMEADNQVVETRLPIRYETTATLPDGEHWFETVKTPIMVDGEVIATTGISRDISDRRKIANALVENERNLNGLLNNIPDLAWMKDASGKYQAVNGVFYTIFQIHPDSIVGKTSEEVFPPSISQLLDQSDDEVLILGRPKIIEEAMPNDAGAVSWYETIKMPVFNEQMKVTGLTAVARDITNRKRAEEAIQQRLDAERMIAGISTRLNGVHNQLTSSQITEILEEIGRFIHADRCIYITFNEDESFNNAFQWTGIAHDDFHPTISASAWNAFNWLGKKIRVTRSIRLQRVIDLPEEARPEIEYALSTNITSLLLIPFGDISQKIQAVVVAETITDERAWSDSDEQILITIGEMLGTTIARVQSEERVRQAESRYRMLVEQISAVVYIDDVDEFSSGIYISPQIQDLVGYTAQEMIDDPHLFWKIIHPDDRDRVLNENNRTNLTGEPFQMEYRLTSKSGQTIWVEDHGVLFYDEEQKKRWFGVIYNVSHRKQIEEALFESEARFHGLFEHSPIALYEEDFSKIKKRLDQMTRQGVTDLREYLRNHPKEVAHLIGNLELLDANHAAVRLSCYETRRELFESFSSARQLKPDDLFIEELVHIAAGETNFEVEGANDFLEGEVRHHHVNVMVLPGHEASFDHVIIAVSDITERKNTEERLVFLSTHDSLTNLYSRSYFETEMARMQQSRQYPISILMTDVDNLKETNDQFGHAAGDKIIMRAAQLLRNSFRPEDVVARLGGDEFAVLIPHTDRTGAEKLLDRLQTMLKHDNENSNSKNTLSLSMGIATAETGMDLTDVLKEADRMMYEEKTKNHHDRA